MGVMIPNKVARFLWPTVYSHFIQLYHTHLQYPVSYRKNTDYQC